MNEIEMFFVGNIDIITYILCGISILCILFLYFYISRFEKELDKFTNEITPIILLKSRNIKNNKKVEYCKNRTW